MTPNVQAFDDWIRSRFVELNTFLEEQYFAQNNPADVSTGSPNHKQSLVDEGHEFIVRLLDEGNTDEGFDANFDLLGNVGFYMGACRRHDITEPTRETTSPLVEASALAMQLGASLGVAPRFASSHLSTHNRAHGGQYKSFTSLEAERVFIEYNTRGILAYKRAADALVRILPMGITHPVAQDLLVTAKEALLDVVRHNNELFSRLDTRRFFYCVRPYYKPYRVGLNVCRGANAGDFAGINEIDMLLGLCRADHSAYSQILVDKFLFMMPEDQSRLRDCMRRRSLLDELLEHVDTQPPSDELQHTIRLFLDVCKAHGATAGQHHNQLVDKFIEKPSQDLPDENLHGITASGPPLDELLTALSELRDLRLAADRDDIPSRFADLARLRQVIQ